MTHSNMKVAEISIATTRRFTRNDERVEQTQWHTVTLWGKLAEIVEKYTTKGSSIYIEGRLETEKWQDQETAKTRYTTKSIAESIQLLDRMQTIGEKQWNTKNDKTLNTTKATLSPSSPFLVRNSDAAESS